MEPVRRIGYREDRNPITGLAFVWMGRRHSHTETLTVSIPDTSRELAQQTPRVDLRVPTTPDDRITLSEATTIYERVDLVNHALAIQVRALPTDLLLQHTHLQRVAPCIQPGVGGGGWC